ncbi:MAG: hypothetical protein IIA83_12485 [Thaumarchaeota archaeon]|nr:hypothetical protein [Nitrososphaerota archaeon]
MRIEKTIDEPVTRGMDSAINKCLDRLDELEKEHNGTPIVRSCDRMEELVNDE